eukprot:1230475-Amphidinium_carterae.1
MTVNPTGQVWLLWGSNACCYHVVGWIGFQKFRGRPKGLKKLPLPVWSRYMRRYTSTIQRTSARAHVWETFPSLSKYHLSRTDLQYTILLVLSGFIKLAGRRGLNLRTMNQDQIQPVKNCIRPWMLGVWEIAR